MKTKNLMVGDWVLNHYQNRYFKVMNVSEDVVGEKHKDGIIEGHSNRQVSPIRLEKIHLTKNGFKVKDADDTIFVYRDGYEIEVIFGGNRKDPIKCLSIIFADKELWMEIEYVHQLQQAMRFFEIEKEIKL